MNNQSNKKIHTDSALEFRASNFMLNSSAGFTQSVEDGNAPDFSSVVPVTPNSLRQRIYSIIFPHMRKKSLPSLTAGFTIIELMISSAIFITVVVVGITVLVNITHNMRVTSEVRQAMDSLNFAMEDMTRNVRLGSAFNCLVAPPANATPGSCLIGTAGMQPSLYLVFEGFQGVTGISNTADQIVYKIHTTGSNPNLIGRLSKSIDGGTTYSVVTPTNVNIDLAKSGFSVYYAIGSPTYRAPLVTMRLYGTITSQNTTVPFDLQTSVVSRNN